MTRKNHCNAGHKALYLSELNTLVSMTMPDAPVAVPKGTLRGRAWRTAKLRPEIMAAMDCLGLRFQANTGKTISYSEMMAAFMLTAIPRLIEANLAFRRLASPEMTAREARAAYAATITARATLATLAIDRGIAAIGNTAAIGNATTTKESQQ